MRMKFLTVAAVAVGAVVLGGCATATTSYSQLTGKRWSKTDINTYDVLIISVDGRHEIEPVGGGGAGRLQVTGLDGERIERWEEDVQPIPPRLDHDRGAHDPGAGREVLFGGPGQASHRQPQAGRRVAGQEGHAAARHRPGARTPA